MTAAGGRRRWKPCALATTRQGVRLALQFAYLILVARVLGVEGYGVFAGSVALATSLSPLVGWGFVMILAQEVSRSPQRFPEFWAKALRAVALSGPVPAGVMLALAPLLLLFQFRQARLFDNCPDKETTKGANNKFGLLQVG